MHSASVVRRSRVALAAFAAASAALAAGALSATPALASTGASLSLSPSSGSDFTSNAATLSWSLPSACVGNEVDTFAFKGTGAWNSAAINTAEGNNGGQTTYYNFSDITDATAATGSTSWPNVSAGYTDFGTQNTPAFSSTGALVSAEGTGLYTLAIACVNPTTFAPVTDSSGNPIATSFLVNLGATGNSWAQDSAVATQVALTGAGTSGTHGRVALKAALTASNGRLPRGAVNFYAGGSATGTPLNAKPIVVCDGKAIFIGKNGYSSDAQGAQAYTAVFVPASPAKWVTSSATASVNLIAERVKIKVTATQDATTPSSLDVTATAVGVPASLATLIPGGGVDFTVDGTTYNLTSNGFAAPYPFNSSGVASATITGLAAGSHTVSAQLADAANNQLNPAVGYSVKVSTVTATTS